MASLWHVPHRADQPNGRPAEHRRCLDEWLTLCRHSVRLTRPYVYDFRWPFIVDAVRRRTEVFTISCKPKYYKHFLLTVAVLTDMCSSRLEPTMRSAGQIGHILSVVVNSVLATGGRWGASPKPRAVYGKRARSPPMGRSQHFCGSLEYGFLLVAFWQQKAKYCDERKMLASTCLYSLYAWFVHRFVC